MKKAPNNDPSSTSPHAEGKPTPDDIDLELGQAEQVSSDVFQEDFAVEQLKHELAEAEKRVLMAQADLENFRRRMRRDMQDQLKYANLPIITEILGSVDNLYRAIEAHERDPNSAGLVQGVQMVAQQISQTLENHGCKKIEAVGQPFDPNLHQAVQMQPSSEIPPNTVVADLRPGFTLHDRVIRPSQVAVSSTPQS
jgi:molecular chaperone GrpE